MAHKVQPRLMLIGQKPVRVTLKDGRQVEGYVNYSDPTGFELIVAGDTRWISNTDLKR